MRPGPLDFDFFVPLGLEQRVHVDTVSAAYHPGLKAQTMRVWASTEQGPFWQCESMEG